MDQSERSNEVTTEETAQEWLQPLAYDPLQHIRNLLSDGLCKPLMVKRGSGISGEGEAASSIDPIVIVQNLKNVLQNVNFGGGGGGTTTPVSQHEDDGCSAHSLAATRSCGSDASPKVDGPTQEEEEETQLEETLAMITRPGTSRAVRVQKALETFFLSLALVYFTIYVLRAIDADFDLEIYTRELCDSSFFSIARR